MRACVRACACEGVEGCEGMWVKNLISSIETYILLLNITELKNLFCFVARQNLWHVRRIKIFGASRMLGALARRRVWRVVALGA